MKLTRKGKTMKEYHKIQSVFKRDPDNHHKTFLMGQYSIPEFEYLQNNEWEWTEKIDGTNIRVMWDAGTLCGGLTFGGKTERAQIPSPLVNKLNELFPVDLFKEHFPKTSVCLDGE